MIAVGKMAPSRLQRWFMDLTWVRLLTPRQRQHKLSPLESQSYWRPEARSTDTLQAGNDTGEAGATEDVIEKP